MRRFVVVLAVVSTACSTRHDVALPPEPSVPADHPAPAPPPVGSSSSGARAGIAAASSKPPRFSPAEAVALLYPDGSTLEALGCTQLAEDELIRCAIDRRYADDKRGLATARAMFDEFGSIAGLETDHMMEGGWRGTIHLVPERPIGRYQHHFDWALEAERDIKRVFDAVETKKTHAVLYRSAPIGWRFMRSVGKRTPSAYASDFYVGYNVSGSLNLSMVAVRDTMVHEIFHSNDAREDDWSRKTIGDVFDSIVAKCGTRIDCLTPYSPMKTIVVGGTYYGFQPNNGDACHEYAAELASRWFIETRAALKGEKLPDKPFKCGPPENATTWKAIVEEFFGGVDLSPSCA